MFKLIIVTIWSTRKRLSDASTPCLTTTKLRSSKSKIIFRIQFIKLGSSVLKACQYSTHVSFRIDSAGVLQVQHLLIFPVSGDKNENIFLTFFVNPDFQVGDHASVSQNSYEPTSLSSSSTVTAWYSLIYFRFDVFRAFCHSDHEWGSEGLVIQMVGQAGQAATCLQYSAKGLFKTKI